MAGDDAAGGIRAGRLAATTISRLEQAGNVTRPARGLYQLPDAALRAEQSLAEASRLVPKGVRSVA
jgi:hypothetical protein